MAPLGSNSGLLNELTTSLVRFLQCWAVLHHTTFIFFFGPLTPILLTYLLFTRFYWAVLLYLVWYVYDFNQSSRGGHCVQSLRRLRIWTFLRDYFPVRMVKTAELDPEHNYIFGAHPHGMFGFGVCGNMVIDVNGFSQYFPGITMRMVGLKALFYLPLVREYLMLMGSCDVSRDSINALMRGKGTAVAIVVGGAKEVLDTRPGTAILVLKHRKGFVRLAIQNGAYLVPTFTFGENELYQPVFDNPPGSRLRTWQRYYQKKFGAAPVLFYGSPASLGILPRRIPLTTVVGSPIPVEKNTAPSEEYVSAIHKRYLLELRTLFDSHKVACGYPDLEIEFVD